MAIMNNTTGQVGKGLLVCILAAAALTLALYLCPPVVWSNAAFGTIMVPASLLTLAVGKVLGIDVFSDGSGPIAGIIMLSSALIVISFYCVVLWSLRRIIGIVLHRYHSRRHVSGESP